MYEWELRKANGKELICIYFYLSILQVVYKTLVAAIFRLRNRRKSKQGHDTVVPGWTNL
jgi:hypothetical protein